MSDYEYDPRTTVKCSGCFGDYEDHEVVQRSCVRGRRQYICFACVREMETPEVEETAQAQVAA